MRRKPDVEARPQAPLRQPRIELEKPEHLARMREVFSLANKHRMAIGVLAVAWQS
ncbi:hypothetical protein [Massilia eurypsychrophila]|uniref:hypothetical protein n=1 Tax=Massilia eurypsychrophila TaxID=1485217 RepID=UPI0015D4A4F6|nr:hypothetical protein [Massilia eurypsychrophila]